MSLGSNRELAENKVILLYIIDKLNFPISNLQLTKLILENRFMNYFLLQQFIDDLCNDNLLVLTQEDNKSFYTITQKGQETISYFISMVPIGLKKRIDNTILEARKKIRNETLITADYTPENENEFVVKCKIHEDSFSLIDLSITVGSKDVARNICNNWKENAQSVYLDILNCLTNYEKKN